MKCEVYKRKDAVQSTTGDGGDLFSITSQGGKHTAVHVDLHYLHSPISF